MTNGQVDAPIRPDPTQTLTHLWIAGLVILVIVGLALWASQWRGIVAAIGIGVLILFAAAAVGAVLGFLFAIPRLATEPKDAGAMPESKARQARRYLQSNTNLDKVSDWLSTMIVGVGLTQLTNINAALLDFRRFLADTVRIYPAASGPPAGTLPTVGPMLIMVGAFIGFIALYLFTRLRLSALFHKVEVDLNDLVPEDRATEVKRLAREAAVEPGAAESPALRAVLDSPQPSVEQSLNLMFSLLYRPAGYQRVIELGAQLYDTGAVKRADFWFYLAAAFGQKHHALLEAGDEAQLRSARDNALDCARRAVALDSRYKAQLWKIADPTGIDNDLADFRTDPQFIKIAGEPPPQPGRGSPESVSRP